MGNGLRQSASMGKTSRQLVAELTLEDIPENCREFVKLVGLENFCNLVYNLGGLQIYIPKFESLTAPARDRRIIQEFDGANYQTLAIRYNISEVWVRQIVNTDRLDKNQVRLFEG